MDTTAAETRLFPSHAVFNFRYFPSGLNENENDTHFCHYLNVYNVVKFLKQLKPNIKLFVIFFKSTSFSRLP